MAVTVTHSVYALGPQEIDGRAYCVNTHTLSDGSSYAATYLAPVGHDYAAHLAAAATQLLLDLAATEATSNLDLIDHFGSTATLAFAFSTVAQTVTAVRAAYANALRTQALMLGDYLAAQTDAALQTAFAMTALQVTTLRANKLTGTVALAAAIRAETGT